MDDFYEQLYKTGDFCKRNVAQAFSNFTVLPVMAETTPRHGSSCPDLFTVASYCFHKGGNAPSGLTFFSHLGSESKSHFFRCQSYSSFTKKPEVKLFVFSAIPSNKMGEPAGNDQTTTKTGCVKSDRTKTNKKFFSVYENVKPQEAKLHQTFIRPTHHDRGKPQPWSPK